MDGRGGEGARNVDEVIERGFLRGTRVDERCREGGPRGDAMLLLPRSAEEVEAVLDVLAHNVHWIVETVLVAAIAVLILQKQYKPRRSKPLTEEVREGRQTHVEERRWKDTKEMVLTPRGRGNDAGSGTTVRRMDARTALSAAQKVAKTAQTARAVVVRDELFAKKPRNISAERRTGVDRDATDVQGVRKHLRHRRTPGEELCTNQLSWHAGA